MRASFTYPESSQSRYTAQLVEDIKKGVWGCSISVRIEVLHHGLHVDDRPGDDVQVPDGVSQRDAAVALEEHHAGQVDDAAELQLVDAGRVMLNGKYMHSAKRKPLSYMISSIYHFVDSDCGPQSDHEVEGRLQTLVLLVEDLLVGDAEHG